MDIKEYQTSDTALEKDLTSKIIGAKNTAKRFFSFYKDILVLMNSANSNSLEVWNLQTQSLLVSHSITPLVLYSNFTLLGLLPKSGTSVKEYGTYSGQSSETLVLIKNINSSDMQIQELGLHFPRSSHRSRTRDHESSSSNCTMVEKCIVNNDGVSALLVSSTRSSKSRERKESATAKETRSFSRWIYIFDATGKEIKNFQVSGENQYSTDLSLKWDSGNTVVFENSQYPIDLSQLTTKIAPVKVENSKQLHLLNGKLIVINLHRHRDYRGSFNYIKYLRCFNYITRPLNFDEITKVFDLLKSNTSVEKVYLTGLKIHSSAVNTIKALLQSNKNIELLGLVDTGITSGRAFQIIEACETQGKIRTLFLPKEIIDSNILLRIERLSNYPSIVAQAKRLTQKEKITVPEGYVCPITHEIFLDPVSSADGETYERDPIERWFEKKSTSPMHGNEIKDKTLIPNMALRRLLDSYLDKHPHLWFSGNGTDVSVHTAIPAEGFCPGEAEADFVESLPFFLVFPSIFPGGELVFPECPESSVSVGASAGIAGVHTESMKKKLVKAVRYDRDKTFLQTKTSRCSWMLVQPLEEDKTLLHLACEQSDLEILSTTLSLLKPYLVTLTEKYGSFLFFSKAASVTGSDGAKIIANHFKWQPSDYLAACKQAIENNDPNALNACVELHIDKDFKIDGKTLLFYCIEKKKFRCVHLLLTIGADASIRGPGDKKPLHLAKEVFSPDEFKRLRQAHLKQKYDFLTEGVKEEVKEKDDEIKKLKEELEKMKRQQASTSSSSTPSKTDSQQDEDDNLKKP